MLMANFEKNLIVNGSLNPSLTLEEILENFSGMDLVQAAWSIVVKLNVFHHIEGLPTHADLQEDPEGHLKAVWQRREDVLADEKAEREVRQLREGEALFSTLSAISTPKVHTLRLYSYQLIGYIRCLTAWNNFVPAAAADVVKRIEDLGICGDFGINNPNTGKDVISWEIEGDSRIVLCIDGMGRTKEHVAENFDAKIQAIMKVYGEPELIRKEEEEYQLRYVMWWD